MTFIDWSDSEGIFGLLIEFVADERSDSTGDVSRQRFLSRLLLELNAINERFDRIKPSDVIEGLKAIHDSIAPDFKDDPVVIHLLDCIEQLESMNGMSRCKTHH